MTITAFFNRTSARKLAILGQNQPTGHLNTSALCIFQPLALDFCSIAVMLVA